MYSQNKQTFPFFLLLTTAFGDDVFSCGDTLYISLPFRKKSHTWRYIPRIFEIQARLSKYHENVFMFVCLFDLILYVPLTIFQLNEIYAKC